MRVALNLEQLLQPAPGGIGRYTAELARLLPALPAGDGDEITLVPFVARHRRGGVGTRQSATWLPGVVPPRLPPPPPPPVHPWPPLFPPPPGASRPPPGPDRLP